MVCVFAPSEQSFTPSVSLRFIPGSYCARGGGITIAADTSVRCCPAGFLPCSKSLFSAPLCAAGQLHDHNNNDHKHDQEGERADDEQNQIFPENHKSVNRIVESAFQTLSVGGFHHGLRILKYFLQIDIDRREIDVPVHGGKFRPLISKLALHLSQAFLDSNHLLDRLRLIHHFEQTLLLDLKCLAGCIMVGIRNTDILGIDRCIDHLAVIFQILHKGIELVCRDAGCDTEIPAGAPCGRSGPFPVIPIGIIVAGILAFNKAAVLVDLVMNAL